VREPLPTDSHAGAHTGCTCSETAAGADPVLDARTIPPAIRHAAIFGALDSLAGGSALVLVAPHDPRPMLDQAFDRYGEALSVEYLERGPEAWRIRLQRT
jgi:uncharacterized protein (DUF2249 family)